MQKKSITLIVFVSLIQTLVFAVNKKNNFFCKDSTINPLAKFSEEWNALDYEKCNTAKDLKYLTTTERDVIWIINMVRLNPKLFINTVLLNPKSPVYKTIKQRNFYYNSLIDNLKTLVPDDSPLMPDTDLFLTAKCHAYESGKIGYVGHDRKSNICVKDFYGECCYYGLNDPFDIVISLLIDEKIRDLGHRKIMLSNRYGLIGVSLQPHISYGTNTVLDFK